MGCSQSKGDFGGPRSTSYDEEPLTEEEARKVLQEELGYDDDKCNETLKRIKDENRNTIPFREIAKTRQLEEDIKEISSDLTSKFEKFDKERSGYVTRSEAIKVLKERMPNLPDKQYAKVVKRFDDRKDTKVNYPKFIKFYSSVKAKTYIMEEKFDKLDPDHDGMIVDEDVVKELQRECQVDEHHARSLVQDFDNNKDGKMNKQEFRELFSTLFKGNDNDEGGHKRQQRDQQLWVGIENARRRNNKDQDNLRQAEQERNNRNQQTNDDEKNKNEKNKREEERRRKREEDDNRKKDDEERRRNDEKARKEDREDERRRDNEGRRNNKRRDERPNKGSSSFQIVSRS